MVDLLNATIAFIGAGNMADALVKGLLHAGCRRERLRASDVEAARRERMRAAHGISVFADNVEAAGDADVVVLAVKPQHFPDAVPPLAAVAEGRLFLSIAAGIPTRKIEAMLGGAARVVRAMPNTPALVGAGISAICGGTRASAEDLAMAEAILGAVGRVVRVEERLMDAVTAVSGSGPAYFFRVMEALESAAIAQELPSAVARELAVATAWGAGRLAAETGRTPGELRAQVTSKGGTTEAALRVLEARDIGGCFLEAVEAAVRRARELAG